MKKIAYLFAYSVLDLQQPEKLFREHSFRIFGGNSIDFRNARIVNIYEFSHDQIKVRTFVSFPSVCNGREIRRIGF